MPLADVFSSAAQILETYAATNDSILVAYSGGKDSRASLDLCCRIFKHVVCFHMHLVPGLACIQTHIDYAKNRWGVDTLNYIHWAALRNIKNAVYRDSHWAFDKMPDVGLGDIHRIVTEDTGINLICHGGKAADSLWRRRQMSKERSDNKGCVYPLKDWTKWDVLAYLAKNDIAIPAMETTSANASASGISLVTPSLLWLHDNHPEDFKRLCKWFPYAEAVVWRRTYYGVGLPKVPKKKGK